MVKATDQGGGVEIPLPKVGTYLGRCYSMIDIGTIPTTFKGADTGNKHKIYLTYELPDQLAQFSENSPPEPFVVGKEFTLSTGQKASLTKWMKAWRGFEFTAEEKSGFDPTTCVGKVGMIGISHNLKKDFKGQQVSMNTNNNTFLDMISISPIMEGMAEPQQKNPYFVFDWELAFDMKMFVRIPKWIQTKMLNSEEFALVSQQKAWTQESFKNEYTSTIITMYSAGEWLPGYARKVAKENNAVEPAQPIQQGVQATQATTQAPIVDQGQVQQPVQQNQEPAVETPKTNLGGGWLE